MRRLFICSTPYQILNAINIAFHEQQVQNDILIVKAFDLEMLDDLYLREVFSSIYFSRLVKYSDNSLHRYFQRIHYLLTPEAFLRDHIEHIERIDIDSLCHYNEICFSYLLSECEAIMALNREAEIIRMEDGIGSYFGDIYAQSFGWKYFLFARLFKRGYAISTPSRIILNNTSFYKNYDSEKACPAPKFDDEFVRFANRVFKSSSPTYRHLIWLSQPLNLFKEKPELLQGFSEYLSAWQNDLCVKVHPREIILDAYRQLYIVEDKGLWELSIHNIDIESKILLGVYSSAQFTPKILFDKEPYVILLYKLFPEVIENQDEMENFIRIFIESYRNRNKVFIPESFEDVSEILDELCKQDKM